MKSSKHLENLSEIRSIMERSTGFLSLSGLSGVVAGLFALAGAAFAYWYIEIYNQLPTDEIVLTTQNFKTEFYLVLFADAAIVLGVALAAGFFFTYRNTKKRGEKVWTSSSKRLIVNLFIPLVTGGVFILILIWHGIGFLISSTTLIFYGLALINASKYTLRDIRYLGFCEIILGLFSAWYIGYGIYFWALGFGILHIFYGAVMYFKYEKNN